MLVTHMYCIRICICLPKVKKNDKEKKRKADKCHTANNRKSSEWQTWMKIIG